MTKLAKRALTTDAYRLSLGIVIFFIGIILARIIKKEARGLIFVRNMNIFHCAKS